MKKGLFTVAVAMLLVVIGFLIHATLQPRVHIDAGKVVIATREYARSFEAKGEPAPDAVDLETLIAAGSLKTSDVSGYGDAKVTLFPKGLRFDSPRVKHRVGWSGTGYVLSDMKLAKPGFDPSTAELFVHRDWFAGGTNAILLVAVARDGRATVTLADGSVREFKP